MLDKKIIIFVCLLLISTSVWAYRIKRPLRLELPLTEEQVKELNNMMEEVFLLQQGRYEVDVVTTTKTNAKNGEMWILSSGGTFRLQTKAGDAVRSVNLTP